MKITLIVTTYQRRDALELVLRSALAQRHPPAEIIVADDGSDGETRSLVEATAARSPVPVRHCWHEDAGFRLAAIRNRALAMAAGDYVVMVDGDLVLHPHFVLDHRRAARPGRFLQGSRVLLSEAVTRSAVASQRIVFGPWTRGIRNRENALRLPGLWRLVSYRGRDPFRVRGANLSFWRADALRVNGFNEEFRGWGREDSEFAARMGHAGLERLHLKFAAVGYHLWHPEASRQQLGRNQRILEQTLAMRLVRCRAGLDQYLVGAAPALRRAGHAATVAPAVVEPRPGPAQPATGPTPLPAQRGAGHGGRAAAELLELGTRVKSASGSP